MARSKGNQLDFLKRATRKSREQTRPARARLALLCPTPSKQQPVGLSNARTALKPEPPIDTRRFFCTSKSCCTGSIIGSIQNHRDLFCLLRLRIPTLVEAHCTAISSLTIPLHIRQAHSFLGNFHTGDVTKWCEFAQCASYPLQ